MSEPLPDYQATITFLGRRFPDEPWCLAAIGEDGYHPGFFPRCADRDRAVLEWLMYWNSRQYNIYWHVNPGSSEGKLKKTDVTSLYRLHVDIDFRAGEDPKAEYSRIITLAGLRPEPNVVVFSGGGFQFFWDLAKPIKLDGSTEQADDYALYNRFLWNKLGGDNCHDLSRLMRAAGTINWPNAKKIAMGRVPTLAEVIRDTDGRFGLHDFEKMAATFQGGDVVPDVAVSIEIDLAAVKPLADISLLDQWQVKDRFKALIVSGDYDGDFPSRSECQFAVSCELARCGVPDEVHYSILMDPGFDVSLSVLDKGDSAHRYALRQIREAKLKGMDFKRSGDENPQIIKTLGYNVRVAMSKCGIVVEYNELTDRIMVNGDEQFQDHHVSCWFEMWQNQFAVTFSDKLIFAVVENVARENTFHPIRDYFAGLGAWDGIPRVGSWLVDFAGADNTQLNCAVGRIFLMAAMRRIVEPGCKFDEMLILMGSQGTGKSSLLAALVPKAEWFSDNLPLHARTKDFVEQSRGKWILECAELASFSKTDVESLKALLSRQMDTCRLSYARTATDHPRQFIMVGTTNEDTFLQDPTGNRRFWPVRTEGEINVSGLMAVRDQVWAEVAGMSGSIRLDSSLWAEAARQNEKRMMRPVMAEMIEALLDGLEGSFHPTVMYSALGLKGAQITNQKLTREIGKFLRDSGWEKKAVRSGGYVSKQWAKGDQRVMLFWDEEAQAILPEGEDSF